MPTTAPDYHFTTRWRVQGTAGEVADVLRDPLDLVRWWPSVFLQADSLEGPDERGLGQRVRLRSKGWLPYTLTWELRVTESRYPERFGALFCTIPLIDMRRYSKLLAGASWIAEYGDPDKPEDWAFLQEVSAYHRAEPGRRYPPILLATSRRDDRVHPGHARKMAAKLQAMGYDASFYEPAAGGHGYGKDNAEVAAFTALGLSFMRHAIGWAPA